MSRSCELDKKVKAYIVDCICSENYYVETNTDEEKIKFLYETFKKEYVYQENLKKYGSEPNCFEEWIKGLPSCFNIDFTNYEILQLAKKWGSIHGNATEKQEDKILNNYWNFIASKTFQLFRKYKLTN